MGRRALRYLFWPELGQRQHGLAVARRLTQRGRDRSFYNLQPSISPDGKEIAFFSDREIWEAIYVLNVETEEVTRAVVQSGREGHHESFRSFKSGIAWSPDGKELAIVSKRGGRDVLHLIDASSGKVRRELRPDVQAILSPDWSRDGRLIAFSGQKDGFADIYVHDLETDETRRLTHDIAHDDKPVFSPSGRWIVFETDRPRAVLDPGEDGPLAWYDSLLPFKDLYRVSVDGDSISLLAGGPWDEKMPSFGPSDSQLVFVSNRSGLDNIYLWQDSAGVITERPLTNLLTGTFTPSWSRDGKRLAFSLFEAGGWDIYLMNDPLDKVLDEPLPKTRFIQYAEDSATGFFRPLVLENLRSWRPDTARAGTVEPPSGRRWRWFGWFRSDTSDRPPRETEEADEAPEQDAGADSDTVSAADTMSVSETSEASAPADTVEAEPAEILEEGEPVAAGSVTEPRDERRFRRGDPFLRDSTLYLDADGNFVRRDYKTRWSFDGATAAIGVDNYYGAGGLGFVNLSDLMGDHRAAVAFAINGSLENISAYVDYAYLKHRLDLTLLAFHESQEWRFQTLWGAPNTVYTNRSAGLGTGVRWPFSPFTRVEAGLLARYAERSIERVERYDAQGRPDSISFESSRVDAFSPTVAWVHDNARWGIVGPVAGRRMLASAQYLPPVFQDENSYVRLNADMRAYKNLYKRYTFAFRLSGGLSEAVGGYANPHRFYVGGEAYTFNTYYNPDNVPGLNDLAQLYFSELDFPLRGYDFFEFAGNRKLLGNAEFRFPFVRELSFAWPLPFSIRHVMGNLFMDYGGAWSEGNPFDQMGLGYGYGMRLNLGIFVLKYTRAWPAISRSDGGTSSRTYWSMGSEF